ncbi:MAG: hypothetical protein OI715_00360 (plasmid) [Candidatus Methanoperedens sp.]|nr:MAG: hypothetical protein OI715_00360 [Candidatus Methanoperedens sp.]
MISLTKFEGKMIDKKAIIIKRKFYFGLLIILALSVVFISGCIGQEKLEKSKLTEESFKGLLTEKDVEKVLESQINITSKFSDYKNMTESTDPNDVINMNSFYGLSFQTEDGMKGITFSVIDFDSISSAQQQFQKVMNESELENMNTSIGDSSIEKEYNSQGIGSILVFKKENKVISLHTAMPENEKPLTNLKGLEELAKIVDERLNR